MDLIEKYLNEADFIDTTQAKTNIDNVMKVITTIEDWLNMARTLVVNGKRTDAMKVSMALKKKADILDKLMKKVPAVKLNTGVNYRRSKWI